LLRTSIRHSDIVCRDGGEEFLVVMPGASLEVACQRAEKLREAVQALHVLYHESELLVTLSLGISAFPEHGRTDEELLRSADQALYRAKAEGRNRVVAWDAGPTQHTLPTSA
jgi:diguanylate cyclase (GGDEF)-like protein